MNLTRTWSAALIILCVIVLGFFLSVPHTKDLHQQESAANTAATSSIPVVTLHDAYRKGTHTITGSLLLPNSCTVLDAEATTTGDASTTEAIVIMLDAPADTGICLQIPQATPFSVSADAPSGTPIEAVVNGVTASTTLQ